MRIVKNDCDEISHKPRRGTSKAINKYPINKYCNRGVAKLHPKKRDNMTIAALNVHVQLAQSGIADNHNSGLLNIRPVRCELSTCFARIFSVVKEYFWPIRPQIPLQANNALTAIDEEGARDFDSGQDGQYHSIISICTYCNRSRDSNHYLFDAHSILFRK